MVTEFDMSTGEIIGAEQHSSSLAVDPQVAPTPRLRLLTVDEATLIQNPVRQFPDALLTSLETAPIDD